MNPLKLLLRVCTRENLFFLLYGLYYSVCVFRFHNIKKGTVIFILLSSKVKELSRQSITKFHIKRKKVCTSECTAKMKFSFQDFCYENISSLVHILLKHSKCLKHCWCCGKLAKKQKIPFGGYVFRVPSLFL